jgi:hypothetical protein
MTGRSILVTFADPEELERTYAETLANGCARIDAAHDLVVGDRVEAVLVHPDSGESLTIEADVDRVEPDGAWLGFDPESLRDALREFVGAGASPLAKNAYERVRGLNGAERRQLALTAELADRVALERIFGKEVWEPLLRNPKLSVMEVARLARMATMPRPLLEQICANTAWLRVPEVRRALLGNTRIDRAMIRRVLTMTPAPELRLVPRQTAYPQAVRTFAKELLERG